MVEFSVIIPSIRPDVLKNCLKSLVDMAYRKDKVEVIVISEKKPKNVPIGINLKYIFESDINPALRRNKGIKQAKGKFLAFIDDDVTVTEHWLGNAKKFFENNPNVDGVGGPNFLPPNASFSEKITDALLTHKYFGINVYAYTMYPKVAKIRTPTDITSSNLIVKKKLIDKIHGFNVGIGYGCEDTELIYILQKKCKANLMYVPSVAVNHKRRPFLMPYFRQQLGYRIKNGQMLFIYPKVYLTNKKFMLFFVGVTFDILLLFYSLKLFVLLFILYFMTLTITSLSLIKRDVRLFVIVPPLLFLQHAVNYCGILLGLGHVIQYEKLKKIRR